MTKSRRLRWAGHVARIQEGRSGFKILTDSRAGKRLLERPRSRWEDNIRKDLKEIDINARNWVDTTQDRDYWRALEIAALNLRDFISHGVRYMKYMVSALMIKSLICIIHRDVTISMSCIQFKSMDGLWLSGRNGGHIIAVCLASCYHTRNALWRFSREW